MAAGPHCVGLVAAGAVMTCPICMPKPVEMVKGKGNILICPNCDLILVVIATK